MQVCKKFSDETPAQWLSDLAWVSDDEKVRALLLDIFSRRRRCSNFQARMWGRIVELYWRAGLTTDEIARRFGVGTQNISRVVKSLRREAKEFFDVYGQPILRPRARKPAKPKRLPIIADPTNESPEHWNAVLASHGLYEPDRPTKSGPRQWENPTYVLNWPVMQSSDEKAETAWGFTFSWGEFFESFQASTEDPERSKGFVAHTITHNDVDRAVDGDPDAREYLRQYEQLESQKLKIAPAIPDPCEGRPFIQSFSDPTVMTSSVGVDVRIDADGSVHKVGSGELHGHVEPRNVSVPTIAKLFFGPAGPNGSSDELQTTEGNEMYSELMDYKHAAEIIKEFSIPRSVIARLAELHLPDLSAWLGGKIDISEAKRQRVSVWVADVAKMIRTMATWSIKVDLKDVENVRHLVQRVNDAELQMALPLGNKHEGKTELSR
jgi:hypothetical protein